MLSVNKLKNLTFRCLAYYDGKYYTAVCLDLGIVEQDKYNLESSVNMLNKAVNSYLKTIQKHNYPSELLYRPAEKKYWRKYKEFLVENLEAPKSELCPLPIFQAYTRELSSVVNKKQLAYA